MPTVLTVLVHGNGRRSRLDRVHEDDDDDDNGLKRTNGERRSPVSCTVYVISQRQWPRRERQHNNNDNVFI